MLLIFALTLALSLPGRTQSRDKNKLRPPGESCIHVSVTVDVSVNVAVDDDGSVNLAWQPGTEPDTAGFNVYRADAEGSYVKINDALIPDNGGSGERYTFVDIPGNGTDRHYMLESMSIDGKRKARALVSVSNP
jgi:hypothetical protein